MEVRLPFGGFGLETDLAGLARLAGELLVDGRQLRVLGAQAFLELQRDLLEHRDFFLQAAELGEVLESGLGRKPGDGERRGPSRRRGRAHERHGQIGHHAGALPVPHARAAPPLGTDEAFRREHRDLPHLVGIVRAEHLVVLENPIFHGLGIIKEAGGTPVSELLSKNSPGPASRQGRYDLKRPDGIC
ncbi:MAG: hypothetical protein M0D55_10500 [Elusimicrobiota bacterium]|nr:MAG: hypothetical protein M0D55_10500 [Elusimicrobiota bacterium]